MDVFDVLTKYEKWLRDNTPEVATEKIRILHLFTGQMGDTDIRLLDILHFDIHVKSCLKLGYHRVRIAEELIEIHNMFIMAVKERWIEARHYPYGALGFLTRE